MGNKKLQIKYGIRGRLRFLSHAEMLRVFQRACVRAAVPIRYSQGFNPRIKISLPLPKTVGIEVEDDRLCLGIDQDAAEIDCAAFAENLNRNLPQGCTIFSVEPAAPGSSSQPIGATYTLSIQEEYLDTSFAKKVREILESQSLIVKRQSKPGKMPRNVDVRSYISAIDIQDQTLLVECKISPAGTIRVDEILSLLEINQNMLAEPVRRSRVKWA